MGLLQLILRSIWGKLIYLPMPWQAIVAILLFLFFLPLLVLRLIPWLIARALQIIFFFAYKAVLILFWIFYQTETLLTRSNNETPDLFQGVERLLRGSLRLLEKANETCQNFEKSTFKRRWIIGRKSLYLAPFIIFPLWFIRPWLEFAPEASSFFDKSIETWCSLEHWGMTGQWQPSALTCSYPNRASRWDNSFKFIEYQNKQRISDLTEQLEQKPRDVELLVNRANAFFSLEEYNLAFKDFNRALDFNKSYAPAHVGKGNVYLELGDIDRAFTEFNTARRENSKYAPAYVGRGDVYRRKNDKEAALAEYQKAYQLNHQYAPTYYSRAELQCYSFGNQVEAVKDYSRAEEIYRSQGDLVNAWKVKQSLSKLDTLYKIQQGDTLNKISSRFNTSVEEIVLVNSDRYASLANNPDSIESGWEIRIPVCR
jgi:tetratricopeptide (TPR) repeat protein